MQRRDQREQVADRGELRRRQLQPRRLAVRDRLAGIAAAAPAVAIVPVLIAEVLEHELAAAPGVVGVLDHRAQLAALDLGAALQRLDVERQERAGLGPRCHQLLVVAPQHAVALEDAQRRPHRGAVDVAAEVVAQPALELVVVRAQPAELRLIAQQLPHAAQHLGRRIRRIDQELLQLDVGVVEQQDAARGLAVAAAAAGLLVIRLGTARDVGVDHQADVGLVDAHPERVGRDDRVELAGHEHVLRVLADIAVEPRVIDPRAHAGGLERGRVALGVLAGRGIDQRDPAIAAADPLDHRVGLVVAATDSRDREVQVRPVEAADVQRRRRQRQLMRDVAPDLRRGRRGERRHPRGPEQLQRLAEPAIVGTEIVPPLRDTVSLIDRDEAEPARRGAQRIDETRAAKPLRRDIDEGVDPGPDPLDDLALLLGAGRRGQRHRGHAMRAQRVDLVLHQRDQRRDHQRDVAALRQDHRRKLITQRFSSAGRHHRHHRPTGQHVADHVGLARAQRAVAEHAERVRQHVQRAASLVRGGRRVQHGATLAERSDIRNL